MGDFDCGGVYFQIGDMLPKCFTCEGFSCRNVDTPLLLRQQNSLAGSVCPALATEEYPEERDGDGQGIIPTLSFSPAEIRVHLWGTWFHGL
jgi:hypothetical protein